MGAGVAAALAQVFAFFGSLGGFSISIVSPSWDRV